ncbi:hypothetical protein TSOC_002514 [Tetrabaena socialis]|uniref:Uncharacterized protein n=1 Tax=Tetrabaena socialis TaxID=47790 RepID=A0A2J8ADZ6_9CHLO|nr:hypothetical protein TSOC_002514 [Tetrabaena socialis]|eukprot:PNH10737.1 hypothetical protein TSOC_002514 [Tetrabaena socialis]
MMELLSNHEPHKAGHPHKDKLAETKRQEAAIHDALKHQQKEAKEAKEQKLQEEARQAKEERALKLEADVEAPHSKRALKEQRELIKQAEKTSSSKLCEHGVQRCRICFPHRDEAEKHHEHVRDLPLGAPPELEDEA